MPLSQYISLTLRTESKHFPKQSPLPSTHRHCRPGARAQPRLTAAVEKGTQEHGCSQHHSHPSFTAAPSPARLTCFSQAGVNQEHFPAWVHSVTKHLGQQLVAFPSSLSENKCLIDHWQRRGQSGNPKEGCKEESLKITSMLFGIF